MEARDGSEARLGRWRLYCRKREGKGTLVLIHGLGLSGELFRGAFEHPALAERGLFVPDLVGFGQSHEAETQFDFELSSQAAAVWDALDEAGIREVFLLGFSMGGTVAACMATQRPDAVSCLIVAEGNLTREPTAWSAKIAAAGEEGFAAEFEELRRSGRFPSLEQTSLSTLVRSARSLQETPERENFRRFLESKRVPVHFLRGEQPPAEVKTLELCAELDIPVHVIEGSGHFFTEDNPAAFYGTTAGIIAGEERKSEAERTLFGGRIKLTRLISRSNIATVWQAHDAELDRTVLVKFIERQYSRDEDVRARFLREAKAIAKLSHANVVRIHDLRTEREQVALVLEFVEGISLGRLLKERGSLPPPVAVTIAAQIAAGLDHAHAAGIIHRDLKPENVMVSNNAEIKITDFGLVTLRDQPTLTQEGMLVGTPAYMAPEQVEGSELSAATDIFALGLILLEMLTGRRLFERNTMQATLQAVQSYKQIQAADLGDAVPENLLPVLTRMLERSPAKRFARAAEVREALANTQDGGLMPRALLADFLSGRPVRYATAQSVARARAWSWRLRAAIGVILLLAGGALVFRVATLTRTPHETQESTPSQARVPVTDEPASVPETTATGLVTDVVKPPVPVDTPVRRSRSGGDGTVAKPRDTQLSGPGYLNLVTSPWANVFLGDSLVGATPLPGNLVLPSGRHRLVLMNPEIGVPVLSDVEISPGMTADVRVNLYDYVARIRIASAKPWADVFVNGELVARTPHSRLIYRPLGTYEIRLRHPDFPDWVDTITFHKGDPVTEIRVDLAQR